MDTTKFLSWTKSHALTIFLVAVVFVLIANQLAVRPLRQTFVSESSLGIGGAEPARLGLAQDSVVSSGFLPPEPIPVPPSSRQDRLVITDTSLSLLVDDVAKSIDNIKQKAEELGGFLVNSNLNAPEGADTGNITVRVPSDQRDSALAAFRGFAVRVTSEQVSGTDVTDQFEDLSARLAVLEKTKAKFEAILEQARTVQESLEVQRELVNLQYQIDAIKGQQKFLAESAKTVRITAFLSTDELALPYAPEDAWRPQAIFRQAVRSLITLLRGFGTMAIWVAVFAPLWLPLLLLLRFLAKRWR